MPRYVAFLRAVNVGGKRVVKMDRLRALFDELGMTNVETFIASGNVLFDSTSRSIASLERRIEGHLYAALGFEVDTFVRPLRALEAVAANHLFASGEEAAHALWVGFLKQSPGADGRRKLMALQSVTEELHLSETEVYWLRHGTINDSKLTGATFEKALGSPVTFRNVTTVRKLAGRMPPSGERSSANRRS